MRYFQNDPPRRPEESVVGKLSVPWVKWLSVDWVLVQSFDTSITEGVMPARFVRLFRFNVSALSKKDNLAPKGTGGLFSLSIFEDFA